MSCDKLGVIFLGSFLSTCGIFHMYCKHSFVQIIAPHFSHYFSLRQIRRKRRVQEPFRYKSHFQLREHTTSSKVGVKFIF